MRRIIATIAIVVMLGGCDTTAQAACRLRIVNYNVAKLNSENPDNRNCVPGSLSVVFAALNDDDKPGFREASGVREACGRRPTRRNPTQRPREPSPRRLRDRPLITPPGGGSVETKSSYFELITFSGRPRNAPAYLQFR